MEKQAAGEQKPGKVNAFWNRTGRYTAKGGRSLKTDNLALI
jgi:hypothetical protein